MVNPRLLATGIKQNVIMIVSLYSKDGL